MTFSWSLWTLGGGGLAVLAITYLLYQFLLHPVWRKERQLIRACDKAFGEGGYRLDRLKLPSETPQVLERLLVPSTPLFPKTQSHTYHLVPDDSVDPDYTVLSREEESLVKHYLQASPPPHYGKETVRQIEESGSSDDPQPRRIVSEVGEVVRQ